MRTKLALPARDPTTPPCRSMVSTIALALALSRSSASVSSRRSLVSGDVLRSRAAAAGESAGALGRDRQGEKRVRRSVCAVAERRRQDSAHQRSTGGTRPAAVRGAVPNRVLARAGESLKKTPEQKAGCVSLGKTREGCRAESAYAAKQFCLVAIKRQSP